MRIERLDLTAYGKFTGRVFDFGALDAGEPDFHIVYGLNEAGKSTLAAAILDLFFGIEAQTRYAFLHPYAALRIGARVRLAGGAREIVRVKRAQNSLLDADGRPLGEDVLRAELHGVDRGAFRSMFSLDDESLEQGGEAILHSKGELGPLLFSASAGLAALGERLESLRLDADRFYKYRARSGELADLKARLDQLKKKREEIDTLASVHADLSAKRDSALAAYDNAERARAKTRARLEDIQRVLGVLPRLNALREAEDQLAEFADLPEPPANWGADLDALHAEEIKLKTQAESAEITLGRLHAEIAAIVDDEAALSLIERIAAWEEPRSRYVAAKDIPARREEIAETRAEIEGLLRRLGRETQSDPGRLMLGPATAAAIRDLSQARSGVQAAIDAARSQRDEAKRALEDALAQLPGEAADEAPDISGVAAALEAARNNDFRLRLRAHRAALGKADQDLADALARLLPWRGDGESLARLSLPGEAEVAAWREGLAAASRARDDEARELERLENERALMAAEIGALDRSAGVVGDAEAARLRAERDSAWGRHLSRLELASAREFEAALQRDDAAGAARLANAADIAKSRALHARFAQAEAALVIARARAARSETRYREAADACLAAAPVAPPPGREALSFLEAWRDLRAKALQLRESREGAARECGEAERDGAKAKAALLDALRVAHAPCDAEASFETLLAAAQRIVERESEAKSARADCANQRRALGRAEKRLEEALAAQADWRAAWGRLFENNWLGEAGATPSLEFALDALDALQDLRPLLAKRDDLEQRVAKMERDQRNFAEEVAACGAALGMGAGGADVVGNSRAIEERARKAREATDLKAEKINALAATKAKAGEIATVLAANRRRKDEMTAFFGVETFAEVGRKLANCAKRDSLRQQHTRAAQDIVEAMRAHAPAEARLTLEAADRTALEAEQAELKAHAAIADRRVEDAFAEHAAKAEALDRIGGDDAVLRIEEERRTILEEIKDKALRHLRLKAGVAAAEEALRLYRDQHRGSMMTRAAEAFAMISRGAYSGLRSQPSGADETLIALGADGGSREAEQLSKGARFQLYLALRVAGYYELAKARAPAPFVADDIMETFDHFRAEEALRLFADMSRVGQVIYLTHHQHLAEIAQRVCPQVRLHDLGA